MTNDTRINRPFISSGDYCQGQVANNHEQVRDERTNMMYNELIRFRNDTRFFEKKKILAQHKYEET